MYRVLQELLDELSSEESREQQHMGLGEAAMEHMKTIGLDKDGENRETGELCENLVSFY